MSNEITQGEWLLSAFYPDMAVTKRHDSKGSDFSTSIAEGITNKADAHLIAAAPDLLKAVEFAMRILNVAESFDKNIGGWKDFKPVAEKALAKAKGVVSDN